MPAIQSEVVRSLPLPRGQNPSPSPPPFPSSAPTDTAPWRSSLCKRRRCCPASTPMLQHRVLRGGAGRRLRESSNCGGGLHQRRARVAASGAGVRVPLRASTHFHSPGGTRRVAQGACPGHAQRQGSYLLGNQRLIRVSTNLRRSCWRRRLSGKQRSKKQCCSSPQVARAAV